MSFVFRLSVLLTLMARDWLTSTAILTAYFFVRYWLCDRNLQSEVALHPAWKRYPNEQSLTSTARCRVVERVLVPSNPPLSVL